MAHKVSILEDNLATGEAFCASVRLSETCEVGHWYRTVEDAINGIAGDDADVVFVDLDLPDGSGTEYIYRLRDRHPRPMVVVYTTFHDEEHLFQALAAGAEGYLVKEQTEPSSIDRLILDLMNGNPPISAMIARQLLEAFQVQEPADELDVLTPRQLEILELYASGYRNQAIADQLDLSLHTVKDHAKEIYRRLQVSTKPEAIITYFNSRKVKLRQIGKNSKRES